MLAHLSRDRADGAAAEVVALQHVHGIVPYDERAETSRVPKHLREDTCVNAVASCRITQAARTL